MLLVAKTAVSRSVILVLCNWIFLAGAASELMYQGPATPTEVSGVSGTEHTLELNGPKALKTIEWNEHKDNPCWVKVWGRNLNNPGLDQSEDYGACGSSFNPVTTGKPLVVGFPQVESEAYIGGVSVCMNNDGTRVKGIRVRGRVPGADGRLTDTPNEPQQHRPNCKEWKAWRNCPEGRLASGVTLQIDKGKEPKSLTGLRLLCSAVAVKTVAEIPPKLVGSTTALDEVSGIKGELVDLLPAGGKYGLDTIFWGERRDNPCLVRGEARDVGSRNERDSRSVDKCSGDIGTGSQSQVDVTTSEVDENAFISGLRVCMNNGRVKGVELEIKVVPWLEGDPPKPKPAPAIDNHRGWLLNCWVAPNADWKNWVRCSKGQIAVGLKAYFERQGSNPRSMTGLGLFCRAFE